MEVSFITGLAVYAKHCFSSYYLLYISIFSSVIVISHQVEPDRGLLRGYSVCIQCHSDISPGRNRQGSANSYIWLYLVSCEISPGRMRQWLEICHKSLRSSSFVFLDSCPYRRMIPLKYELKSLKLKINFMNIIVVVFNGQTFILFLIRITQKITVNS